MKLIKEPSDIVWKGVFASGVGNYFLWSLKGKYTEELEKLKEDGFNFTIFENRRPTLAYKSVVISQKFIFQIYVVEFLLYVHGGCVPGLTVSGASDSGFEDATSQLKWNVSNATTRFHVHILFFVVDINVNVTLC